MNAKIEQQIGVKITDMFAVGDTVEWSKIRIIKGRMASVKFTGEIREIKGSSAIIISPDYKDPVTVSLFTLTKSNERREGDELISSETR